ncbi:MAG: hypothetical protein ACK5II_01585 [Paracoccus sp. (in: a-proteobacteria)]
MRYFVFAFAVITTTLTPVISTGQNTPNSKISIGETVAASDLHIVSHPGRYGLGPELPGSRYAVIRNYLVRIDAKSHKVQSVIRKVPEILD